MEPNSPHIISGNHVTDLSGNPNKLIPQTKKPAGNIFGGGGNARKAGLEAEFSIAMIQSLAQII